LRIGANILQGPHQSAKKSTKTGVFELTIFLKLLFIFSGLQLQINKKQMAVN